MGGSAWLHRSRVILVPAEHIPRVFYRVGRGPQLWTFPPKEFAGSGRFDDPFNSYLVLYAGTRRLECFIETLSRFRLVASLHSDLAEIDEPDDFQPCGSVPEAWAANRFVGSANVAGNFANICSSESLSALQIPMMRYCREFGQSELDAAALQGRDRRLTKQASRLVYEDAPRYDGIRYLSRFGHDLENFAVFDRISLEGSAAPLTTTDPDFLLAMRLLRLRMPLATDR